MQYIIKTKGFKMTKGICPKCNGTNVYTGKDKNLYYGERTRITLNFLSGLRTMIYICTDCGFAEEYVTPLEDLDKLKNAKQWMKVSAE